MLNFLQYLKEYFRHIPRRDFLLISLFTAALIVVNYTAGIEFTIKAIPSWEMRLVLFYFFYLFVLGVSYLVHLPSGDPLVRETKKTFLLFLLAAPLYFAVKMVPWQPALPAVDHERLAGYQYWIIVLQWPAKLLLLIIFLYALRLSSGETDTSFFGCSLVQFKPGPYFLLLLIMIPIIASASLQADFLRVYPKLGIVNLLHPPTPVIWPWRLLFEICYGIDFISVELFFRGFLVIGMMRLVGARAILPMAALYCSVHFGKPLGECISSYFGGLVLGVIAYRTQTIAGGLMVHLGIAWMMELGGWLGHLYVNSR